MLSNFIEKYPFFLFCLFFLHLSLGLQNAFRRVGTSNIFGLARDPSHPFRAIPIDDDVEFKAFVPEGEEMLDWKLSRM